MKKTLLITITTLSMLSATEYECFGEYSWPIGYKAKNIVYLDDYTGQAYYYKNEKKISLVGYVKKKYGTVKSIYFVDETNGITIKYCNSNR